MDITQKLAASGFADTSRVGGGNPQLGLDLAVNNKKNILDAIKKFKEKVNDLESLIKNNNWDILAKKLSDAKKARSTFIK